MFVHNCTKKEKKNINNKTYRRNKMQKIPHSNIYTIVEDFF